MVIVVVAVMIVVVMVLLIVVKCKVAVVLNIVWLRWWLRHEIKNLRGEGHALPHKICFSELDRTELKADQKFDRF